MCMACMASSEPGGHLQDGVLEGEGDHAEQAAELDHGVLAPGAHGSHDLLQPARVRDAPLVRLRPCGGLGLVRMHAHQGGNEGMPSRPPWPHRRCKAERRADRPAGQRVFVQQMFHGRTRLPCSEHYNPPKAHSLMLMGHAAGAASIWRQYQAHTRSERCCQASRHA